MRVLLSTIGSRGDVQPLLALGLQLREMGVALKMCVPPDFVSWIATFGIEVTPIGPELRPMTRRAAPSSPPAPDQLRAMVDATVATQFETLAATAEGCDLIVGATALQIAAPSIAEKLRIPYVFAAFCPTVLPSPHHAPPVLSTLGEMPAPRAGDFEVLWAEDALRWNRLWGPPLNAQREARGLPPVIDVRSYVLTDRPLLAADPILAPWPGPADASVIQTGAWLLRDESPLPLEVEDFLADGPPPIYFGFGSMHAPEGLGRMMIQSARALGRRAIIARGWADLSPEDDGPDCIGVGEINQQALFARVAAVVHHGGAGTTTAALRAGAPQVIIPQMYDQYYFADRVGTLGVGSAYTARPADTASLKDALERALQPEVMSRARELGEGVLTDGAEVAARHLLALHRVTFG